MRPADALDDPLAVQRADALLSTPCSPTSDSATRLAFHAVPGPNVPFPLMEAQLVTELPRGDGWQYEPKWDGFRGVLENDGGEERALEPERTPLLRYFELRPLGELCRRTPRSTARS